MLRTLLALVLVALLPTALPAAPLLDLDPEQQTLTVSQLVPGASVALFGVDRRLEGYISIASGVRQILSDSDGDGRVVLDLGRELPLASLWVAVDLASGASVVAWPVGFEPQPLVVDGLRLEAEGGAAGEGGSVLRLAGRLLEVFVLRPGELPGTWHRTLSNGGPADEDDDPAAMALRIADLEGLAGGGAESAPAPAELEPADVIVLLDPSRLRWLVVEAGALSAEPPGSSPGVGGGQKGGVEVTR